MKWFWQAIGFAALTIAGCSTQEPPKDAVAHVGDRMIDVKELHRSYLLHPAWKRGETEIQSYLTQAGALVTQKLYAQEAEKLGLENDSLMRGYLGFLKEKEMIKGLYRREVRGKVTISEREERQLYGWMKKNVDYEYVFARDSARCLACLAQFRNTGISGIPVPPDSSLRVGKETAAKVGSVPRELEQFLFTSGLNAVSRPIRSGGGFAMVKLVGGSEEKFLSENDFAEQKEKIDKLIADRQSDSIASHYIATMMRDKDLRLNANVFWQVAEYFGRRVKEAHVDPMNMQSVYVTGDEIQILDVDLNAIGGQVVATHRDGQLTVKELIAALATMPGSLRPRVRTPQNLKNAIGGIVRNQYLLKEAARQGLADDPEVLYEYHLQRDETLANAYYTSRRGATAVSPDDVERFKTLSPVSEEQVFFKFNMTSLARDAKADSILRTELPALEARYHVAIDTARVRSLLKTPDAVIHDSPLPVYIREIFL